MCTIEEVKGSECWGEMTIARSSGDDGEEKEGMERAGRSCTTINLLLNTKGYIYSYKEWLGGVGCVLVLVKVKS